MKIKLAIEKAMKKAFKEKASVPTSLGAAYTENGLLKVVEKKGTDYVLYGEDNLTPQKLKELVNGSPIHSAIIKTKTTLIAGDGLLINGAKTEEDSLVEYNKLSAKEKAEFDFLIKNPFGNEGYGDFINKIALDYSEFGAFCYEIVWNSDFTKVASYNHIPLEQVRSGKMEGGKVEEYYRSLDWACRRPDYNEYYTFKKGDKEHVNQLVYYKKGGLMYYGEPDYAGAIMWIQIDYNMGLFHLSNIENGMNPGLHFKFRTVPASDAEKQNILDEIKQTYKGAKNTGKFLATFSSSADTQTEISPIESSTLDKQLVHLSELCDSKILSGHQLTSPLLAGISIPGKLGGDSELELGFKLYNNLVTESARNTIIRNLSQHIFNINIPNIKLEINPYNPLKEKSLVKKDMGTIDALNSLNPMIASKILDSMTQEQILALIGLQATTNNIQNG